MGIDREITLYEWPNTSNTVSMNGQGPLIYGWVCSEKWPYYGVHKVFMNKCDGPNDSRACLAIDRGGQIPFRMY